MNCKWIWSILFSICLICVLVYGGLNHADTKGTIIYIATTYVAIFGCFIYRLTIKYLKWKGKVYSKYLILIPLFHRVLDIIAFTAFISNISVFLTGGYLGCWDEVHTGIPNTEIELTCAIFYQHCVDYAVFSITVAPLILFCQPSLSAKSIQHALKTVLILYLLLLAARLTLTFIWAEFTSLIVSLSMLTFCLAVAFKFVFIRKSVYPFSWIATIYCIAKVFMEIDEFPYAFESSVIVRFAWPFNFYCLIFTLMADTDYWTGQWREPLPSALKTHHSNSLPLLDNAAERLQELVDEHALRSIEFSALSFSRALPSYASKHSEHTFYRGIYNNQRVDIKCFTPLDVTVREIAYCGAEASLHASLAHRNIVKFLGICVLPPQICLVFEACERGSLATQLDRIAQDWSWPRKLELMHQLVDAVTFIHSRHLVHGSIQPSAFLLREDWSVSSLPHTRAHPSLWQIVSVVFIYH